jgi:hypothetical protein
MTDTKKPEPADPDTEDCADGTAGDQTGGSPQ